MTRQALGFQAPVAYAISEGAATPNPGLPGVQVWSTTINSLMVWGGANWNTIGAGSGDITLPCQAFDGGFASAVYLPAQNIDGGAASTTYSVIQHIQGGTANG